MPWQSCRCLQGNANAKSRSVYACPIYLQVYDQHNIAFRHGAEPFKYRGPSDCQWNLKPEVMSHVNYHKHAVRVINAQPLAPRARYYLLVKWPPVVVGQE